MTSAEKLEKVEKLIAARDEITEELLELMGAAVEDEGEEEEEEEKPTPKYAKEQLFPTRKNKNVAAGKTGGGCAECGSPSKHKSSCSKSSAKKPAAAQSASNTEKPRTILDEPRRLTREQFDEIREQAIDGLTAAVISYSYPDFELPEIQRAIRCDNYQFYLR